MGHYYRELFPREAAEQDARIDRHNKLYKELRGLSLDSFTVGDLPGLLRVMDSLHFGSPSPEHLSNLEQRVSKIKTARDTGSEESGEPLSRLR